MSIVNVRVPEANENRPTAPKRITSTPNVRDYIAGYDQLSALGAAFYPIRPDKSPAVKGRLARHVTIDPTKILYWAERQHHRNFAVRIPPDSRLLVLDTESPFKHSCPGPYGELVLSDVLEENGLTLPRCPMVETASSGYHRYLLVPRGFRITSSIALWPGVDILAAGSNVILPGSRTETGAYRAVRSFEECAIPEAPRPFIKLIRETQKERGRRGRSLPRDPIPDGDIGEVSRRQWWLLFRNQVFASFWNRKKKQGDTSDSAYEYHIAKACFCCGLTKRQTSIVIRTWWRRYGMERRREKLERSIIPAAWREVSPWVDAWRERRLAAEAAHLATKTSSMIREYVIGAGAQTPASISAALPISRERAKKAMQRMAKNGALLRIPIGYVVPE